MSSYSKPCIFCNQEIKMSNDSGNWLPFNLNGSPHVCKDIQKKAEQFTNNKPKPTLADIDTRLNEMYTRLKKIEAVLFGE